MKPLLNQAHWVKRGLVLALCLWSSVLAQPNKPTNPAPVLLGKPLSVPDAAVLNEVNTRILANVVTAGASFDLANLSSFENTLQVIAPGTNASCPQGKAILSMGEPGDIYTRDLFDDKGNFLKNATPVKSSPIKIEEGWLGTDNILMKPTYGVILMVRSGVTWREDMSTKPAWWRSYKIQGNPNGARVVTFILKSADCGKTWEEVSKIDPLVFADGKYAVPRPLCNCFGGWDRQEAYFDPWTKALYVSMNATGGVADASGNVQKVKNANGNWVDQEVVSHILFKSPDGGKTWAKLHEFGAWTPIVMTSTPNGRLYLYSVMAEQPYLKYSLASSNHTKFSEWYPVNYHLFNNEKAKMPAAANPVYSCGVYKATNSISRATLGSDSKVRLTYSIVNGFQQTGLAVFQASIEKENEPPILKPIALLYGKDKTKDSILSSTFVEPDVSSVLMGKTAKSFLYWVEAQVSNQNNILVKNAKGEQECSAFSGTVSAHYFVLDSDKALGAPKSEPLSSNGLNAPKSWTIPNLNGSGRYYGDYAYGASFFWKGDVYFFGQWREPKAVAANYIKIKP